MNGEPRVRTSSLLRLRDLPPVFDLREVERAMGCSRNAAKVTCSRWKRAGLVSALGPRNVGVFFNLIADPNGLLTRRAEALQRLLRRPAVLVGPMALHAHGWTTQRPHRLQLAVPITREVRSLPTLDHGLRLLPRSIRWFSALAETAEPGVESFLVALPEMALADALLASSRRIGARAGRTMGWEPSPDETDVDPGDAPAWASVRSALLTLGASAQEADALLQPYRAE